MTIFSFNGTELNRVDGTTFSSEGMRERQNLQAALKRQIEVVAPNCLVISEEFSEWSDSQRRIDLLAVNRDADLVVIELKRTETGDHMELQALRYAAMVSTLTFDRAVEIYQRYLISIGSEIGAEDSLLEFFEWESAREDDFASDVHIVLVSSDFSKELTTSVMWLNERNIDIKCVRFSPHKFQDKLLIDVQQIIPLPEAESYQIKIRQKTEKRREAKESSRDFTHYLFNNIDYNKRKLVLAVIQSWIKQNSPNSLADLQSAFPKEIRSGKLFVPIDEAKSVREKQGIDRHFLEDDETISFPDSSRFAISNQWGKTNIDKFIAQAKLLGFDIEEIA